MLAYNHLFRGKVQTHQSNGKNRERAGPAAAGDVERCDKLFFADSTFDRYRVLDMK